MSEMLSLSIRMPRLQVIRDAIDAAGGLLDFYTGTKPSTPQTATGETLLATIALANPSGAIDSQSDTARYVVSCPRTASVAASGIIGWCRFNDGAGKGFMDLRVGHPSDGYPVVVSNTQVYAGGEVQLLSCVMVE